MLLGIAEDFTSDVTLDTQLTATPTSGLYYNSGVHQSVNVDNLLHFLPNITFTFAAFNAGTTYGKFLDSRIKTDIVTSGGSIFESIAASNLNNAPASSPTKWQLTNIESLRLKAFIQSVEDKVISDINLSRRQIDSQFLYNLVEQNRNIPATLLSNDFAAWVFEPKGSDYVEFEINQVALQATFAGTKNLFVINQGQLKETIVLNTNAEGRLEFQDVNFVFSGKGQWIFAIESQNVLIDGGFISPLKYDGFVAYTATGTGATPEGAIYDFSNQGNGLSFNITVHLSPEQYLTNNLKNFGQFLQSAFELEAFKMFLSNSNNRVNLQKRVQMSEALLTVETRDLTNNTAAKRYHDSKKRAIRQLEKTFDREINNNDEIEIQVSSV